MNSAQLRQEVVCFYSPEKVDQGFGDYEDVWNYEGKARAGVLNKSMNRSVSNDEIVYDQTRTLVVRSHVKVKENWRILWDGCKWNIISIVDNKYFNDKEIIIAKVEE